MNPVALISMLTLSIAWIVLGYAAVRLGGWVGVTVYLAIWLATTNASLWRLVDHRLGLWHSQ